MFLTRNFRSKVRQGSKKSRKNRRKSKVGRRKSRRIGRRSRRIKGGRLSDDEVINMVSEIKKKFFQWLLPDKDLVFLIKNQRLIGTLNNSTQGAYADLNNYIIETLATATPRASTTEARREVEAEAEAEAEARREVEAEAAAARAEVLGTEHGSVAHAIATQRAQQAEARLRQLQSRS